MSLVPETPEEEARVQVWNLSLKKSIPRQNVLIKEDTFKTLVLSAPRFDSLAVATGFWREGGNQLEDKSYIQAFYSFFFVIEDLFADGRTSEKEVLKVFSKSQNFCKICNTTVRQFFGKGDEHEAALRRFFEAEGCEPDVPGLQKFLFRMRGNMHHYFGKSPRPHPTPFNQEQFHAIALLALYISSLALAEQIFALKKTDETA